MQKILRTDGVTIDLIELEELNLDRTLLTDAGLGKLIGTYHSAESVGLYSTCYMIRPF